MPGPSPGCHYHDIETQHAFGKSRIPLDIGLGRPPNTSLRLRRHRLKPRGQRGAPLDLNEDDDIAAPGNEVDLAHLGTITPGEDAVTGEQKPKRRQPLAGMSPAVRGTAAARPGSGGGHAQPLRLATGTTFAASGWIGSSGKMKRQ